MDRNNIIMSNYNLIFTRPLNNKEFVELCDFLEGLSNETFFCSMDLLRNMYATPIAEMKQWILTHSSEIGPHALLIKDKHDALQVKLRYG